MSEPFLSEIKVFGFDFAPKGWAICNGQLLPINQNQALFSLLGTTYGGDGRTNFALPDLRARTPIHQGSGHLLGERGGETAHTLSANELPTHTHNLSGVNSPGGTPNPTGAVLGQVNNVYHNAILDPGQATSMSPEAVASAGGSQSHPNMQPYLALNFCIALQGIFPSRN